MSESPPIFIEESEEDLAPKDGDNGILSVLMKTVEPQDPIDSHTFVVKRARSQKFSNPEESQSAKKQKFNEDDENAMELESAEINDPGDEEPESEKEDESSEPEEPEDLVRFREQRKKLRRVIDKLTKIK